MRNNVITFCMCNKLNQPMDIFQMLYMKNFELDSKNKKGTLSRSHTTHPFRNDAIYK